MRVRFAVLALLALSLGAPGAIACTWVLPTPFSELTWLDHRTLFTHDATRLGRYDVVDRRFAPLAAAVLDQSPSHAWALAPDGRALGHAWGAALPQRDYGASCDTGPGRTAVIDLATGQETRLLDGGAEALAASARHLAVAHSARGMLLYAWGDLGRPRELPAEEQAGAAGFNLSRVRAMAFSPDGSRLAVVQVFEPPGRVFVFETASGALLANFTLPEQDAHVHLAFGPGGELAVATGGLDSVLLVYRVAPGDIGLFAARRDVGAPYGLDWARHGLALSTMRAEPNGEGPLASVIHVFAAAPDLTEPRTLDLGEVRLHGDLAFSPDGSRLALADAGELLLLDPETGAVVRLGGLPRGSATPGFGAVPALAAVGLALAVAARRARP